MADNYQNYSTPASGYNVPLTTRRSIRNPYRMAALNFRFVPEIPNIMRNKKWIVGASFQEKWLNGNYVKLKGKARDGIGSTGNGQEVALSIENISVDWVLSFQRARNIYQSIFLDHSFESTDARVELKKILAERFTATESKTLSFGDFKAKGKALDQQFVTYTTVGYPYELDDLAAALGSFAFYIIPGGIATKTSDGIIEVNIDNVGVYIRDSFDFNGDQFLGFWANPDYVSINQVRGGLRKHDEDPDLLYFDSDSFNIANSTYEAYRNITRMGADFIVYSDVIVKPLDVPVYFALE